MARSNRISCSASAPGKIILFGEHAVVHSQPAIAASLSDLRMNAICETRQDGLIVINLPDLRPDPIIDFKLSGSLLQSSKTVKEALKRNEMEEENELIIRALDPLLYLIKAILPTSLFTFNAGITFSIQSGGLPIGAGLGSSAAFCVAASAALVRLCHIVEPNDDTISLSSSSYPQKTYPQRPSHEVLETINHYAFEAEKIINGNPSGVDNYVSCFGGAVCYQKILGQKATTVKMGDLPQMDIILTNTHVPKSTKKLVAKVAEMKQSFPDMIQGIFDAVGAISSQFRTITQKNVQDTESGSIIGSFSKQDYSDILTLIQTNQKLLQAMGVSHPSLDAISLITDDRTDGIEAATKLTGAGGGGCAFTLLSRCHHDITKNGNNNASIESMKKKLCNEIEQLSFEESGFINFQCFESRVGGEGVLWTDPEDFLMDNKEVNLSQNQTLAHFPSMLDFNQALG